MKWFSFPNALALFLFGASCALLLGQVHVISSQGQQIEELLGENTDLRESLTETEGKIDSLLAMQADIRTFQRELSRFVKDKKFGSIKNFDHLLASKDQHNAQFASLFENDEASPSLRLARIEMAAENAKFDIAKLYREALQIKNMILQRPTLTPTLGRISSIFGQRKDPFSHATKKHNGVDIVGKKGTPIYASADGVIRFAKREPRAGYGNRVEISHEDHYLTRYAHLDRIFVKVGERVKQGQLIATMGNSGTRCQGTHLHYEILHRNRQVDPQTFMKFAPPTSDHQML